MNLVVQIGVSLLVTGGMWLAGHLVRRRVKQLTREAGIEWPAQDVGLEVSPGLMRAIAITDWLHHLRFSLLGGVFCLNFLTVGWISDRLIG